MKNWQVITLNIPFTRNPNATYSLSTISSIHWQLYIVPITRIIFSCRTYYWGLLNTSSLILLSSLLTVSIANVMQSPLSFLITTILMNDASLHYIFVVSDMVYLYRKSLLFYPLFYSLKYLMFHLPSIEAIVVVADV